MSAEEVANSFARHYYNNYANVENLRPLFTPQSTMTFEGTMLSGVDAIIEKLRGIGQVTHSVKTVDVQPSPNPQAIYIFVTGACTIDGGQPLHYCEFIHLVNEGGSFYVHNSIFRLNYGL